MTLARRDVLAIAAFALVGGLWLTRSAAPPVARPTSGTRIIAFGDSLVAGRGASDGRDLVSLLSKRLGVPITNAGRSGDTTSSALARIDRDVLTRNPRVVIVLLGGNDFLRGVPIEQTFANLGVIVDRLRRRGSAVVLVGVNLGLFTDQYSREYAGLARRTSAGLVPDILSGIIGHANRMSDSIHPNDAGYEMMADRIEPVLRDLVRSD